MRPQSPMLKVLKKLLKFISYLIIILIVLALLFILGFSIYFQSDQTKVISGFPGMGDIRIEFDQGDTDVIDNYPHAQLSFKNFKIVDASDSEDEKHLLAANNISLEIKSFTWLDKRLSIRNIRLDTGEVYIHKDSLGRFNFSQIGVFPELSTDSTEGNTWSVVTDSIQVKLNNVLFTYLTDEKHQSLIISTKSGTVDIYQNPDGYRRVCSLLDLRVIDFTLKPENGSLLKEANVYGSVDLYTNNEGVHVEQSTLSVNDQEILASAVFFKDKEKYSYLHLINSDTEFEEIKPLLTPKLQRRLQSFKVEGEFQTDAILTLMSPHPIRVDIDFVFPGNTISINEQVFYNTKTTGHFVNDNQYDRTFNKIITERGHLRFDIISAETVAKGASIHLDNALISAGKDLLPTISSNAHISGPSNLISDQLENDKFMFIGGTFDIDAKLKGQLYSVHNMIEESELDLTINKCNVHYLPSQVVLPIQTFILSKKSGDAKFNLTGLSDDQKYDLVLDGKIIKLMDVINGSEDNQSSSYTTLKAKRLSWEDFINILGEGFFNNVKKTSLDKSRDMKKTLQGFEELFKPNIFFEIDSSGYYDYISLENIVAHMHFPEKGVLAMESTTFDFNQGNFDFSCNIDISSEGETPFEIYCNAVDINLYKLVPSLDYFGVDALRNLEFLPKDFDIKMNLSGIINDSTGIIKESLKGDIYFNSTKRRIGYAHINLDIIDYYDSSKSKFVSDLVTTIEIKGNPRVFNTYLNNDEFFFNNGKFELNAKYTGEKFLLDKVISEGEFSLTIDSSFVFYKPLSVTFPLTHIGLDVKENNANYSILLQSDSLNQEINLDGKVQNISQIIVEDTGLPVRTTSNIYSPSITWKNFFEIFEEGPNEVDNPKDTIETSTNTSTANFCELLHRFSPKINMQIDTLEYSSDLSIHDFSTALEFVDTVFYVSDAQFVYRDSDIVFNSIMHIADDIDSIILALNVNDLNIKYFITDIEELTNRDLSDINYMTGTLDIDVDISQYYTPNDQVSDTITNGAANFTISDLVISEAPWMEKISDRLWYADRFKNVKFAAISNQVTLTNDTLYIPLMEIQSSAFDIFVDGHYHSEYPHVWVSIPIHNLMARDTSIVPEKEGYDRRKAKFHLEYKPHKESKPKFRFRLRKPKLFNRLKKK